MDVPLLILKQLGILDIDKEKIINFIINHEFGTFDYILLTICGACALYGYTIWQANYFKRRGIKNIPFDFPFVGNMYKTLTQQEHFRDLVQRTYKAFPDQKYVGQMQINKPLIMIRDLDILKQVAIKDFDHFVNHEVTIDEHSDSLFGNHLFSLKGDKWRDMRATLSPAFTSSKMRNMLEFIADIGNQMAEYYVQKMEESDNQERGYIEVEMKDAFTRYTNDVIASSAFGVKVNSLSERDNEFYEMGKKSTDFSGIQQIKFFLFSSFPRLMALTRIPLFKEEIKDFFRGLVLNTMKTREEQNIVRHDMIHLLMEARKGSLEHESEESEENETGFATVEESEVGKRKVKRQWTDDDIVAQALLFFIAGFDTSSTLLCFMAHELAINPDIQKRLQEEIDEIVEEKGHTLEYNDLSGMKYMDMVVSETLRMWPPAVATDRQCIIPYQLPPSSTYSFKGHTVKPGEGIWIPIYGFHHDPQYFPDPEKFDPERFSDENKGDIQPFSYIPFGIGPRNCIGSRFALMEAKAVMFHLLSRFDFIETERTENPIQLATNTFGVVAKNGFWIGLKPRATE